MFLTQFDINVARRDAMRLLASPERLHAAVLGAFPPGQSVSDGARTLWRLDRGPARHDARLMIVSPLRPDLDGLGWSRCCIPRLCGGRPKPHTRSTRQGITAR